MSERFAKRIAERKRRDRLLLVFAPDEMDERPAEQKSLLEARFAVFEGRVLVPLFPVGDIEAMEEFGVRGDAFAANLIGKDGTEKARFERPVEPGELFRRIDETPMRNRETRRREMGRGA